MKTEPFFKGFKPKMYFDTERACPECGGEGIDVKREIDGNLFGYKCQSCNGTGEVKEREAGE